VRYSAVVGNFADAAATEDDEELDGSGLNRNGPWAGWICIQEEDPMSVAPLSLVPIPSPENLRRGSPFEYQSLSEERM